MEVSIGGRTAADNARFMTKLSVIGSVISAGLLILTLSLGVIKSTFAGSDVFAMAVIPFSLSLLFSIGGVIYGMLANATALEDEEKILLSKRSQSNALNVEEDVRFTAGRSFENYKRFAPYVLTILAAFMVFLFLYLFYSSWQVREIKLPPTNPLHSTLIAALMTFGGVFSGAFFVGQSRLNDYRWLRPIGAWLIAGFAVMFVAMVVGIFNMQKVAIADVYAAKVLLIVFIVLGVELISNFIIEFYRPRTIREERPIFESRLLSLFTEPGGVMRNIALTLDYQFGFKISGTWLYSFMERSFFPVVLFWLALLWGFTTIHEVGPSQVGVKISLGSVVNTKPLTPGIYWTLPWPFGNMNRYSCTEIHAITIGSSSVESLKNSIVENGYSPEEIKDKKKKASQVILWTVDQHGGQESNYIMAVPDSQASKTDENVATPIDFIRIQIPIQYRIKKDGVMDFVYKNINAPKTLLLIGEQAVTEYLASSSIVEIMSTERKDAERSIQKRVQALADEHKLGIEIIATTITDAHPPIEKVAPAFQSVIGAMEEKESIILKAKTYQAMTIPAVESQASRINAEAKSYSYKVTAVSKAEAERFKTQLNTYSVMPEMFKLKSYLDMFEKDGKDIRKYIVSSDLAHEVYELNFEENQRLDLINADITALGN